ncbi:hypothetical protein NQ314_004763 [Rhamnusium bicolor]|uniref:Rab3 GTPase-activating protein catalytic subunit n=1 Tax=Rhamnusium bicolor TaxID=1586634 RepID=A0AAV8ZIP6_9CUCU|nr:hypothetical protein NQ314_004763 [Rhamnusium bicolor]
MNEEIDDSEFYHQDFTTASEWEIFIARMEEIINQWKTDDLNNELLVNTQNIWDMRSEKLTFADFDFNLNMYRKKIDGRDSSESSDENEKQNKNPINTLYDFELYDENNVTDTSCLSSWYGIIQLSYTLQDFGNFIWKQDALGSENYDVETLFVLPFGVTVDPVSALVLKATWNHLSDHLVVDSENYSDFDPMTAPRWSCLIKMTNEPVCLLGDCLTEFLQNLSNNLTVYDILGDFAALPSLESNPLDLLTEPTVPTISNLLSRAARNSLAKNKRGNPPISDSVLVPLLYFLFPDADEKSNFPYGEKEDKEPSERSNTGSVFTRNLEEEFKGFKTSGVDSLTWRLSIVLAHSLQSLGGIKAFAHIWYEFVQEMRYRWEKSMLIPG